MKNIIYIAIISLFALSAQAFLVVTNPPANVQLAWNASITPGYITYNIYYGTGSGQYSTKVFCGTNLTATIPNLTRGTTYYFAATALDTNGLESSFSNEVNYMPPNPPLPPTMKPVVLLTVQTKSSPTSGQWADAGMNWSVDPNQTQQLYRLQASLETPTAAERIADMKLRVVPPPIPGK